MPGSGGGTGGGTGGGQGAMTDRDSDARWMGAALALARRGLGRVWPNPAVGCVIVAGGRVVGRGWTADGGRPHAETLALAQAGAAARGATAYVTLEPCAHHGQTPPCAEVLAAAGIARVVVSLTDPDPRVAGRGLDILRAAGVAVALGHGEAEAMAINRGFLTRVQAGRPMVTLKLATTLDGRIATASGESRWITGAAARARVHLMRASHDAVLVGAGTARADDPMLDVRLPGLETRRPVRIVADPRLSLSLTGRLARSAAAHPLWLLHGSGADKARAQAWAGAGAVLIPAPLDGGGNIDIGAALAGLGERGLTRVLCEGGGRLAASLMAAGLVDELAVFSAGLALGGDAVAGVAAMAVGKLAEAPRFTLRATEVVGADVLSTWVAIRHGDAAPG